MIFFYILTSYYSSIYAYFTRYIRDMGVSLHKACQIKCKAGQRDEYPKSGTVPPKSGRLTPMELAGAFLWYIYIYIYILYPWADHYISRGKKSHYCDLYTGKYGTLLAEPPKQTSGLVSNHKCYAMQIRLIISDKLGKFNI